VVSYDKTVVPDTLDTVRVSAEQGKFEIRCFKAETAERETEVITEISS